MMARQEERTAAQMAQQEERIAQQEERMAHMQDELAKKDASIAALNAALESRPPPERRQVQLAASGEVVELASSADVKAMEKRLEACESKLEVHDAKIGAALLQMREERKGPRAGAPAAPAPPRPQPPLPPPRAIATPGHRQLESSEPSGSSMAHFKMRGQTSAISWNFNTSGLTPFTCTGVGDGKLTCSGELQVADVRTAQGISLSELAALPRQSSVVFRGVVLEAFTLGSSTDIFGSAGAWTTIFNRENGVDNAALTSGQSGSLVDGVFTCNIPGYYLLYAEARSDGTHLFEIQANLDTGSGYARLGGEVWGGGDAGSNRRTLSITVHVHLNQGDKVAFFSDTGINYDDNAEMLHFIYSGHLIYADDYYPLPPTSPPPPSVPPPCFSFIVADAYCGSSYLRGNCGVDQSAASQLACTSLAHCQAQCSAESDCLFISYLAPFSTQPLPAPQEGACARYAGSCSSFTAAPEYQTYGKSITCA